MQPLLFAPWLKVYAQQAALLNERRLVALSGSGSWALSLIESANVLVANYDKGAASYTAPTNQLIYGDSSLFPSNVPKKNYRDKLGSESDMIIFADSHFTVDAFAALSGTLKAGGIFFLIVPEINAKQHASFFLNRFYSLLKAMPSHAFISQKDNVLPQLSPEIDKPKKIGKQLYPFGCRTAEQHSAVKAIDKVVTGHRKRPLVLTADRGRGKSSALAIACAQLMQLNESNEFNCIITAPNLQALTVFYQQLKISLPKADLRGCNLTLGKAKLSFMAVDQLIKQPQKINLLIVDEAAAIPVYLLEQLLSCYHRMVFSSTVHGYEGAGRGFTLKFQQTLSKVCPQWQSVHIKQPIRWRVNDPLEQLVFDTCLLNAELPDLAATIQTALPSDLADNVSGTVYDFNATVFKVLSSKELLEDEVLLRQIFAILVTAHYQTKPSDLQLLLDNPQVQVACLFSSDKKNADVIGVALLMNEGRSHGAEEIDVSVIKNSQKRLRNQFLPQSLLSYCGFEQAFDYCYLRIMRIAVHPQLQQQGVGSHFLSQIQLLAIEQGADFTGTSFGVNASLLSFWLKAGFTPCRIGFTKDNASGEHSALLLQGGNDQGKQLQQSLKNGFYRSFDYLLLEEYKTLSSELVYLLLIQQSSDDLVILSALDIANVSAFSQGERLYSSCVYSLYLWLKHDLLANTSSNNGNSHVDQDTLIFITRLIQKHDVEAICQQYDLTGKKQLNQTMQNYVGRRLESVIINDV